MSRVTRDAPALASGLASIPDSVDVLVAGLGATGAGVAVDAASRGLSVVAVDAHDVAFGTSRWSSKLVHGGLRYLAHLQVGVAHQSAVERDVLMRTTAPHLVHPLPMLMPLYSERPRRQELVAAAGFRAGDLLRLAARTPSETLPRPRRLNATEALRLAPAIRRDGLRGGLLGWDGQMEDDARLVLALARTAVREGARVHTRVRVVEAGLGRVVLRDEVTGESRAVAARAIINATGVWAGSLSDSVTLRPSRGSHLVVRSERLDGLGVAVTAPIGSSASRFVFALPEPDGLVYVGLTDEPVDDIPDVPTAPKEDVDALLDTIGPVLRAPLTRADVVGTYAGLRPLLRANGGTADLSRHHAVLVDASGVVTVVGGKLTTYRRMAEDAVDRAAAETGLDAGACRTRSLPLVGATRPSDGVLPGRLARRYGSEADVVLASARSATGLSAAELLEPIAEGVGATLAELVFGVTHEGARDVGDLLDRRLRLGLVPADRARGVPAAKRALALTVGATS